MKASHPESELTITGSLRELLQTGREAEEDGEYEQAINTYRSVLKRDAKNESAYNRLFILYRKLKDYPGELKLIDEAIAVFTADDPVVKNKKTGNIQKLSLSLGKITGLMDKKGKSLYDPEPVATWKRRRLMVQKRLKAKLSKTQKTASTASPKKRSATDKVKKTTTLTLVPASKGRDGSKSNSDSKKAATKTIKTRKK